jgi:hypothetical protein
MGSLAGRRATSGFDWRPDAGMLAFGFATRPRRDRPGSSHAMIDDPEALAQKLAELETEHRDLDAAIEAMQKTTPFDGIQMQRLKKRKLALRDQIARIQSLLVPDIIA